MTYDVAALARRRMRKALLGGVVVLLVVGGLVAALVAFTGGSDTNEKKQNPPQTTSAHNTNPVIPPETLRKLVWSEFQGVELPYSPTCGPQKHSDGLASGFTQDPLGAVLAAIHISVRTNSTVGSDVFRPTIRDQMTGPNVEKFLAGNERDYEQTRKEGGIAAGKPLSKGYAKLGGFRIEHYDDSYAAIHLVVEGPTAQGGSTQYNFRIEIKRIDGDWKALVPVNEEWDSAISGEQAGQDYIRFPSRG